MSEGIKSAITGREGINVSGDGLYSAITGKKSAVFSAGKVVSAITGRELKSYEGACSSGSTEGSGKYRVRFFDYDGTILKTVYTDGGAVTAPNVPDHERLLFQEWNNDFDDITADLDVGAIYTTKSGKCEFDIDINSLTGLTQYVGIRLTSGTVTIEWGDGTSETLSTIGDTRVAHTYAASGKYMIMVSGTENWMFLSYALGTTDANESFQNRGVTAVRLAKLKSAQSPLLDRLYICETLVLDRESTANGQRMYGGMANLRHCTLPRGLDSQLWMFVNCYRLNRLVFPDSFTSIKGYFCENSSLRSDFVLPPNITLIEGNSFGSNGNYPVFSRVTIPSKVVAIHAVAFVALNGESSLRTVIMKPTTPPTIQAVPGNEMQSSFPIRGSLKEIIVPAGCGEAYKSATNWSYYADIIKEEE